MEVINLRKEVKYMNVLKALAIISVVMGHCGFPYASIIYSYHMALFFFITGYFFKDSYVNAPIKFIVKKIQMLYIPFVMYEFIFVMARNFLININIYDQNKLNSINSLSEYITNFKNAILFRYTGDSMLGTFWFLKVLFFVNILFIFIMLIWKKVGIKNKYIQFVFITSIYLMGFYLLRKGLTINYIINPWHNKYITLISDNLFDIRVFVFLMIYYLGYLYKKYEEKISINIYVSVVFLIILYLLKGTWIDTSVYSFKSFWYFLIVSMMGIYFNIYIAKKLSVFKMSLLIYIGTNSLTIMIFHFIAFKIVNYIEIIYYGLTIDKLADYPVIYMGGYWWILYTIVGTLLPIIIKYGINTSLLKLVNRNMDYKETTRYFKQ